MLGILWERESKTERDTGGYTDEDKGPFVLIFTNINNALQCFVAGNRKVCCDAQGRLYIRTFRRIPVSSLNPHDGHPSTILPIRLRRNLPYIVCKWRLLPVARTPGDVVVGIDQLRITMFPSKFLQSFL